MDLLCNVRSCRKPLTGTFCVTSCSHCFCNEHSSVSQKNMKCPVCSISLGKRFDIIRQDSNPSEGYKAMLLVGLRPEIVLDIAMRAVTFWTSQAEQEIKYKSNSTKNMQGAAEKIKAHYEMVLKQLAAAKKLCDSHEKLSGDLKNTIKNLKDQLAHKDRQLQKMQYVLSEMKSKMNSIPRTFDDAATDVDAFQSSQNINLAPKMSQQDFVFEPTFLTKRKDL